MLGKLPNWDLSYHNKETVLLSRDPCCGGLSQASSLTGTQPITTSELFRTVLSVCETLGKPNPEEHAGIAEEKRARTPCASRTFEDVKPAANLVLAE